MKVIVNLKNDKPVTYSNVTKIDRLGTSLIIYYQNRKNIAFDRTEVKSVEMTEIDS